ncbi:MAG: monofunctional biosynthetic peptidoglycan transglycosylase [Pseudomonadota bacterium]
MAKTQKTQAGFSDWILRQRKRAVRAAWGVVILVFAVLGLYAFVNVGFTPYQLSERWRLGAVEREWVSIEEVSRFLPRSLVAAEDANYCLHWGFDMAALRAAIDSGARRGGSTISQQTVKNAFLWQDRSWVRKALEALLTPAAELVWTKRRMLEIYLNIIEFDEGVFGAQAAARHYFDIDAADLNAVQAARLAAILPNPKARSASQPTDRVRARSRSILDGAATIARDARSACFET